MGPHSEAEAPKRSWGNRLTPCFGGVHNPQVKDVGNGQIALWNYWMKNYVPLAKPCFFFVFGGDVYNSLKFYPPDFFSFNELIPKKEHDLTLFVEGTFRSFFSSLKLIFGNCIPQKFGS